MAKHHPRRSYTTSRAGEVLGGIRPTSLATALYRNGHYCGIKPFKLPNGRLLWPADEIDALAAGAGAGNAPDVGARLADGRRRASARRIEAGVEKEDDSAGRRRRRSKECRGKQRGFIMFRVITSLAAAASAIVCLASSALRVLQ